MATETITPEQKQRAVLSATKECPGFNCRGTGSMQPTRSICQTCIGTGRVLLFPKAGERCPGEVNYNDPRSRLCSGRQDCRGGCKGTRIMPTQDIGRLLEACRDNEVSLAWNRRIDSWEAELYSNGVYVFPARGAGNTPIEALWEAMYAVSVSLAAA